jgi:hypothetical protein
MLSPGDRAIIKAEIERLQKAQRECTDSGIRRKIDVWIEEQKQKLALDTNPPATSAASLVPRKTASQMHRAARFIKSVTALLLSKAAKVFSPATHC